MGRVGLRGDRRAPTLLVAVLLGCTGAAPLLVLALGLARGLSRPPRDPGPLLCADRVLGATPADARDLLGDPAPELAPPLGSWRDGRALGVLTYRATRSASDAGAGVPVALYYEGGLAPEGSVVVMAVRFMRPWFPGGHEYPVPVTDGECLSAVGLRADPASGVPQPAGEYRWVPAADAAGQPVYVVVWDTDLEVMLLCARERDGLERCVDTMRAALMPRPRR